MEAAGELQIVRGANREEEIGGIVDFYQRQTGNKAVLFDDIPGYPRGYRAVANILTSTKRIKMTLGLPADATDMELVAVLAQVHEGEQDHPAGARCRPGWCWRTSTAAPTSTSSKFPAPKWHEHDGGYYIGTGDMVIMRHPDTGWINYGAYRVQVHDKNVASVMCSKGKHGNLILRPLSGARAEVPDRGGVRHAPGAVHGGGPRNPLRQERIRRRRRPPGRAGRGHPGAGDRPADPGQCRDRVRGLRLARRSDRRRPARRMDRLLRRRPQEGAGDPRRERDAPRQSGAARRHARHPAGRRLVLSLHLPHAARSGTSSKPPACRR